MKLSPLDAAVQAFVKDLLPIYDLDFARQKLAEADVPYEFRGDVVEAIHRSISAKVEAYPQAIRHMGLDKLESISDAVLKSSEAQDAKQLMLAVAYRNLGLLERGWFANPQDQAVLVSLLMTGEAEQDGEEWGSVTAAKACADRMILTLKWKGLLHAVLN